MSIDNNKILQQVKTALDKAIAEKKISQEMVRNLSPAIIQTITPVLQEMARNSKINKQELLQALSKIKIDAPKAKVKIDDVRVDASEVTDAIERGLSNFRLPKPEITYNAPKINFPNLEWPKGDMGVRGWLNVMGYDKSLLNDPLPVQLRDASGKPVSLDITNYISGGGGGGRGISRIGGIDSSAWGFLLNGDNRLKVETNDSSSDSSTSVIQVSGAIDSVNVTQWKGTDLAVGDELAAGTPRVALVNDIGYSVSASQAGTWNINGSTNSVVATGATLHDAADDGDAPLKTGGIAMTANPTAVAGGDRVATRYDDIGRQLVRPVQVRDLLVTAYASVTNITETALLAGTSGVFHDLIYVMGANHSDAAVVIDIRCSTGGTVAQSISIPANGTAGVSLAVPYPAPATDSSWTIQNAASDDSGTEVDVTALFTKEV